MSKKKAREPADRITVGLTPGSTENLKAVMETGWFSDEIDAFRAAIAVALAKGVISDPSEMSGTKTKYNFGSLNADGKVAELIELLMPAARRTPAAHAERLADAGLEILAKRLGSDDALLFQTLTE